MTFYPIAIAVAIGALYASAHHLNQNLSLYYDFVAAAMVFGGTLAVALVVLPWEYRRDVLKGFKMLFWFSRVDRRRLLRAGLELVQAVNSGTYKTNTVVTGLPARILNEGAELIQLGLPTEKIETILRERVYQAGRRTRRVANAIRSLAKYPPAFGLMGTVLGLVSLMRGIASGLDAKQTGVEMAVALIATFYGLITANLVVNPAGEMVLKNGSDEEDSAELALQAVLLASDRSGLLESQELLNSFVGDESRVDYIGSLVDAPSEAA